MRNRSDGTHVPLTVADGVTESGGCVPLTVADGVTESGGCVPLTDNGETQWGDISSQMGGHSESNDLRLDVPIQNYPDIPTSNVNRTCIKCGAGDLAPLVDGLALCRACDTAQPSKTKGHSHV